VAGAVAAAVAAMPSAKDPAAESMAPAESPARAGARAPLQPLESPPREAIRPEPVADAAPSPTSTDAKPPCAQCEAAQAQGDRFCSQCAIIVQIPTSPDAQAAADAQPSPFVTSPMVEPPPTPKSPSAAELPSNADLQSRAEQQVQADTHWEEQRQKELEEPGDEDAGGTDSDAGSASASASASVSVSGRGRVRQKTSLTELHSRGSEKTISTPPRTPDDAFSHLTSTVAVAHKVAHKGRAHTSDEAMQMFMRNTATKARSVHDAHHADPEHDFSNSGHHVNFDLDEDALVRCCCCCCCCC